MTTLFSPLQLGATTVPNRIFMAPLTRCRASAEHVPTALMAEYYAQRASAGLIIAEATMAIEGNSSFWMEPGIYSAAQVEQLARLVDEMGIDVFAFGITADFRTSLFPGSQRLIELADRVEVLQVQALCWCGARATHNARTVGGIMVVEGAQVVVGDTALRGEVAYEVLCRRHHMRRMTSIAARAASPSPATLTLDD